MNTKELLLGAYERASLAMESATKDLRSDEIKWRPGPLANPIGFILWHVTRGEDRFVNVRIRLKPQVWDDEAWRKRLGFTGNPADTGSGYTAEQLAAFNIPQLGDLMEYNRAVRACTVDYLKGASPDDLNRLIEIPGRPAMSVAEMLLYFLGEINNHTGQVDYIRGLVQSLRK